MMKKMITMLSLGWIVATVPALAQTMYDAAKMADKDLNGTARFVGMGGAMSALGGDLSTIGSNPAGLGIYRSSDAMLSFGFSSYGTESNYALNRLTSNNTRGSFDNAGFVFASKIGNATTLRYLNFGFNYKRAKSFYKNMQMRGNLGDYTQTDYMAAQAADITDWGGNLYTDPQVGWLAALGYDSYLITDLITYDGPAPDDAVPYMVNGVHAKNRDGKLLYRTPGEYGGMYWGGNAQFRSEERGGIDQYDFNLSFNLCDRVYLGVTVGAYVVDYSKYTFYDEDYGGDEGYNLQSWNKIDGTGFDVKLGIIARPFEYSPLRVGLAVHTPTFYHLDYKTNARVESDVLNDMNMANESGVASGYIGQYDVDTYDILNSGDMVRRFQLRTPWTVNASLGYTIGKNLALGAEYEYQNYSSMELRDDAGYSDSFGYENSTMSQLKRVHTVRIGAEYKPVSKFALRAGYNYTSALFHADAYKDLAYNSIQTDTDFSNVNAKNCYTFGLGYRGKYFYADMAYKFSSYKEDFYPFINAYADGNDIVIGSPQATKVTNKRHQMLFTLGMKF